MTHRLRQDAGADHRRHARRRVHARRPRGPGATRACSTPAPRPASTSPSTTARTGSRCAWHCPARARPRPSPATAPRPPRAQRHATVFSRPRRLHRPRRRVTPTSADRRVQLDGALPVVPVTDLVVKDDDLVVATQGRAFWILDDIAPLRQITPATPARTRTFQALAPPIGSAGAGRPRPDAGQNPPAARSSTTRSRASRRRARRSRSSSSTPRASWCASSRARPTRTRTPRRAGGDDDGGARPPSRELPAKAGLNRFAWDLRYPDASRFKGMILWAGGDARARSRPRRLPGCASPPAASRRPSRFEVASDPRLAATGRRLQKQFDLQLKIRDKLTETHDAITRIRDVRDQLKAVAERAKAAGDDEADRRRRGGASTKSSPRSRRRSTRRRTRAARTR